MVLAQPACPARIVLPSCKEVMCAMSKKARKGGPSRKRKVPKPILPDFPTAGMATAVCPHCGDRFGTEAIVGGWLDRRCPLCGGILRTSCCDEAALRFLLEMKEIESDLAAKRRKSDEAQHRIDSHRRWWQMPYRWYWSRVRAKADARGSRRTRPFGRRGLVTTVPVMRGSIQANGIYARAFLS